MAPTRRSARPPKLQEAVEAGLRLLSHRPRSEWEVRHRLAKRFPEQLVESAVHTLKDRGLVEDSSFALFWRQSRERHRPRGSWVLKWELRRMGVAGEVIDEALEGIDEEENAYRAAIRALPHDGHSIDPSKVRERIMPYLRRRGFAAGTALRAVTRVLEELPDPHDRHVVGEGGEDEQEHNIKHPNN